MMFLICFFSCFCFSVLAVCSGRFVFCRVCGFFFFCIGNFFHVTPGCGLVCRVRLLIHRR